MRLNTDSKIIISFRQLLAFLIMKFRPKSIFLFLYLAISTTTSYAQFSRIDSLVSSHGSVLSLKEEKLTGLKNLMKDSNSHSAKIDILNQIIDEYRNLSIDSALLYSNQLLNQVYVVQNPDLETHALLQKARIFAEGSFFIEANEILQQLDPIEFKDADKIEFYKTKNLLDLNLFKNSKSSSEKQKTRGEMAHNLDKLIESLEKNSPEHFYYLAEKLKLIENREDLSLHCYLEITGNTSPDHPLYPASALEIAHYYQKQENREQYLEWLIKAAEAELQIPLKNQNALRELTLFLFNEKNDNIERATRYLTVATEDIVNFNNPSDIHDIAGKFPEILSGYISSIKKKERASTLVLIIVSSLLMAIIAVLIIYIRKQHFNLRATEKDLYSRDENLRWLNTQIHDAKGESAMSNEKLEETNTQLKDLKNRKENLTRLWRNTCLASLGKLKSYKLLVKQKVKANLASELLDNSTFKPIEDKFDQSYLNRFDKAFLELFPDFIAGINQLLKQDSQINLKSVETLNTELRICALIRLGVTDSADMADLLFCSPQTIYNNRTRVRNRAIDKDSFEQAVRDII